MWNIFRGVSWISGKPVADLSGAEVVDSSGQIINKWTDRSRGLNEFEIGTGHDVRKLEQICLRVKRLQKRRLGDCLYYEIGCNWPFSDHLLDVIESRGVVIDPEFLRVPLVLVDNEMRPLSTPKYKLLWPKRKWKVLDFDRARVRYYHKSRVVAEVEEWKLRRDFTPGYDLVACEEVRRLLCTDHFRAAVEEAGGTGMEFEPITD